jgi:hypothetical protein
MKWICWICLLLGGCKTIQLQLPRPVNSYSGTEFYQTASSFNWKQRDSLAVQKFFEGHVPEFLKTFIAVPLSLPNGQNSKAVRAVVYVSPDYISIGNDHDWARIPLTPMAAKIIADSLKCFLPTRKIVNDIYNAATVKLSPVPLFAFRDSSPTMYHHHLIIEGQRRMRKGLIAGIKKDVVSSGKLNDPSKHDRVAIYGWHQPGGKPIQPLYTGHVNWYVDYSHGVRLVYRMMKVNGKWMDYQEVMRDPELNRLFSDEE